MPLRSFQSNRARQWDGHINDVPTEIGLTQELLPTLRFEERVRYRWGRRSGEREGDCKWGVGQRSPASGMYAWWLEVELCARVHACWVASPSLRCHGLSPTRLLCPWHYPGKEYCSGLPCPPPGDILIQASSPHLLHWQVATLGSQGRPDVIMIIEIKCTIHVMHLNLSETIPPLVHGKNVFYKSGPQCQKSWGALA